MSTTNENEQAVRATKRAEAEAKLRAAQLALDALEDDAVEQRQQLADITNAGASGATRRPASTSGTGPSATEDGALARAAPDPTRAAPDPTPSTAPALSTGSALAGIRRSRSPDSQELDAPVVKKRRSRAVPADQQKSKDYVAAVESHGRRFAVTMRLFLHDRTLDPLLPLDPHAAPDGVHPDVLTQVAAERADINSLIPQDMKDDILRKAFMVPVRIFVLCSSTVRLTQLHAQFVDGMQDERHRLRGRIHATALPIVGPTWANHIARGETGCDEFRVYIGFKKNGSDFSHIPYYDHDAPALHAFATDTYYTEKPGTTYATLDIKTRFRNPHLKLVS